MRPIQRMVLACTLLILLSLLPLTASSFAQETNERCFPEATNYCIEGRFLEYWEQNGGLPVFGYPITYAREEYNRDTGQTYLTQWFERARFELHPENTPPYDVLLGRLGDDLLLLRGEDWQTQPRESGPQPDCRWFEQTGHNVCDQGSGLGFKTYWENHGLLDPRLDTYGRSLALFGLPLTEARTETNSSGHTVLTQWFERARFEWHPDRPDEFKVLLGLLGNEYNPGAPPPIVIASSYPENLTAVNDALFFSADDGTHGRELWQSDGTESGTRLVKDIFPGPEFSTPVNLTNMNGTLFFNADDGQHGDELWQSDGTPDGTVLIKDINPGSDGSSLYQFMPINGTLYFIADDGVHGAEVWQSDGTEAGTRLLKDIKSGEESSYPYQGMGNPTYLLTNVNGRLFFFADDGVHGIELWTSDGTAAGTTMVKDLSPGADSTFFFQFVNVEGTLFFVARDIVNGYGLWRSDGTATGTTLLNVFAERPTSVPSLRSFPPFAIMAHINGTLFLSAWDAEHGDELWQSDGTPEGTVLLQDITPGPESSSPQYLTDQDGSMYFTAMDAAGNRSMWRTDGTPNGTTPVNTIDALLDAISIVTAPDGTLFFLVPLQSDAGNAYALWKSDSASAEPVKLRDFYSTENYLGPEMQWVNGMLFLSIADETHGIELWRSDGTPEGTTLVKDIFPGSYRPR